MRRRRAGWKARTARAGASGGDNFPAASAAGGEAALPRALHDNLAQRSEEARAVIACPAVGCFSHPVLSVLRGDSVAIPGNSFHFP